MRRVWSPPGSLVDLVPAIDLCGICRRGSAHKAPLYHTDDDANPPRFAPHVIFRAGSVGWHVRRLFLPGVDRMCIVCPAATSRRPGGYGLAFWSPRSSAHPVVGTDQRLRCRFRSKRACGYGRRVLTPPLMPAPLGRRLIEIESKSGHRRPHPRPWDIWRDSEAYDAAFDQEIRRPETARVTWSVPKSAGTKVWTASRS